MIRYTLRCTAGHGFESWFRNSETCDKQLASGDIICPTCGQPAFQKAIMAPRIATGVGDGAPLSETPPTPTSTDEQALPSRAEIEKNSEYVGKRFPEEARRIHYGETEKRAIYGEATVGETLDLLKEGVPVLPLPRKPDA